MAQPTIILLRHAEKPKDKTNVNLSHKGLRRAAALAPYLLDKFGPPCAIYAMKQGSPTESARPIQTITPTATQAKLPVLTSYDKNSYPSLVNAILSNTDYTGKTVYIVWEHKCLDKIAKQFGVSAPKWDSDDFCHTWQLTYSGKGYTLKVVPQKLMYGDSSS